MGKRAVDAAKAATEAAESAERAAKAAARVEDDEDIDPSRKPKDLGPLFDLEGEKAEEHAYTRVYRLEPVDEGHLDDLPKDADRKDIRRRWGGGRFRVQACNARGKILSMDSNINISGDPIFENEVAKKRYDKWFKQQFPDGEGAKEAAEGSSKEELADARHRRELERIKAEHAASLERIRAELDAKEAAEERRRKREREERDEARKLEREEMRAEREREREERRAEREAEREARAEERRDRLEAEERRHREELELRREEMADKRDPTNVLMQGLQIGAQMAAASGGAAEYPDATTALIANIDKVRGLVGDVATMAGGAQKNPAPKKRPESADDPVTLDKHLSDKTKKLAAVLAKQGKDPGKVIAAEIDRALNRLATPAAKSKPKAVNGQTWPAKAVPPAKNGKAALRAKA